MSDVKRFVDFLRTKFRSERGPDESFGGHDIEFSNSLLYEGAADTEGGYATAIDYTALLRKIDTFAREFEKKK